MTPWVTRLIIANVAMFFFASPGSPLFYVLWLVPAFVPIRPWTVVTYMFLHAGLMHLLFNMLGLFFFGPRLEVRLGGRQFLTLYFLSGLGGALFSFLPPFAPVVGASGAVFGVFLGFARFWPNERVYIWGVLPVQARVLVFIMTALSLYGGLGGGRGGVAHFAHLGGFGAGYLYLKMLELRSPARQFRKKAQAHSRSLLGDHSEVLRRWEGIDREGMHPVNQAELDRVLLKIKESGAPSLTADERAFLERFISAND